MEPSAKYSCRVYPVNEASMELMVDLVHQVMLVHLENQEKEEQLD